MGEEFLSAVTGDGAISIWRVIVIMTLIALTNMIDTSAYAARLAGVRTKRLAISNTLYSMLTIGSRTTTALYLPLIGGITDVAKVHAFDPLWALLVVLFGASIGTVLGVFLMPTMVNFYVLGIRQMDVYGTPIRMMKPMLTTDRGWKALVRCYQRPRVRMAKAIDLKDEKSPRDLYILNGLLYSLFTVGSIAALYAGFLSPERTSTANQLSSSINAVGAFLLLFTVDPGSAMIIDRGISRQIPLESVRTTMVMLAVSRLAGTLLAPLLLYPGGHFVAMLAKVF